MLITPMTRLTASSLGGLGAHRTMAVDSDPTTDLSLALVNRRRLHATLSVVFLSPFLVGAASADDFITTPSGLKVLDIR